MRCTSKKLSKIIQVPIVALILGWAGVVPFVGLTVLATYDASAYSGAAIVALVGYGALILSFMGGVLWGLEMSQGRSQGVYAVSIVPALVAAAAMSLQATYGILLLLCGFAGLLAYDLKRSQSGGAPSWYPVLRLQLTAVVIVLLLVVLLFARPF